MASRCSGAIEQLLDLGNWAEGNDIRIRQVLASHVPSAINQLRGLGGWAGNDDVRIGQILSSGCPAAIKQISDLAGWAKDDHKIAKILSSICRHAIASLRNETLAGYFFRTGREINEKLRIEKERIHEIKKLVDELALEASKASEASEASNPSTYLSLLAASPSHPQLSASASGRVSGGAFVFAASASAQEQTESHSMSASVSSNC